MKVPQQISDTIAVAAHAINWDIPRGEAVPRWLDEVVEAGYDGVAMFGMQVEDFVDDPDVLAGMLTARGLRLAAVTGFVSDSSEWTARLMDFMTSLGATHLACTDFDPTLTSERAVQILDERAMLGDQLGINVYYHNHTGGVGGTLTELENLLAALDPAHRHLMLDVGHATKDFFELPRRERAAAFLERHWGNVEYLELKDWNETTGLNTPLGEGYTDFDRIAALIARGGYRGWIVVEQNGNRGSSLGRTAKECAVISRTLLRGYGI